MKKFPALAVAATMLVRIGPVFAGTRLSGDSNNGAATPPATSEPVVHSTASAGVGVAAAGVAAALVYAAVAFARHQSALHSEPSATADHMLSGGMMSVDAVANTIEVKTKQGEMILNVDPAANVKVRNESRLADLKTASKIKISYKMDGNLRVATRIS